MNEQDKPTTGQSGNGSNPPTLAAMLAARAEDFVSLHDLLNAIAASHHGTYQEAAQFVQWKLETTHEEDFNYPSWCRLDPALGILGISEHSDEGRNLRSCLRQAAQYGQPPDSPPEDKFDDDIPF